jgi:hypothetical protein
MKENRMGSEPLWSQSDLVPANCKVQEEEQYKKNRTNTRARESKENRMGGEPSSSQSDPVPDNWKEQKEQQHKPNTRTIRKPAAKSPTELPPTMNARSSSDSPIALRTPLTFKAPLSMPFKSPFMKNPLYEKAPVAVNLAPAAMDHHAEKVKIIPQSPVAKARQLGSDFFSSWKYSMQSPKPDNAARARQISQELCSPYGRSGPSQDGLFLRKALQKERQQARMATNTPTLVPPPTASLKSVPSPNQKAQQISQELCKKTRSDTDCTDLSFTIDTPPGTPAKSVHPLKQIALEPHSPDWEEGELTDPWESFHVSPEMLIKNAVIKKTLVALIMSEPPSQNSEDFQETFLDDDNDNEEQEGEKIEDKAESQRSTLILQALDVVHTPFT